MLAHESGLFFGEYKMLICRKCGEEIPVGSAFCNRCGARQEVPQRKFKQRGNGQGTVYQLPNGKYRAEFRAFPKDGPAVRHTKSTFPRKKDAFDYLAKFNGSSPPLQMKSRRLIDLHEEWQKSRHYRNLSKDKRSHYKTAWARLSELQFFDINYITVFDLQDAVDALDTGYYPKKDVKQLLSALYKTALKYDAVDKDRSVYLELPPMKASSRRDYTKAERDALWKDYRGGNGFTRNILLMMYMALRTGELMSLDPDKVDLKKQYAIGGIKTEAGINREIPIANIVLPLVKEALAEARTGLCSTTREDFYVEYAKLKERTGITSDPYSARHTAVTALVEAGVDPRIVSAIVGHADAKITEAYTHISVEEKVKAVNKMNISDDEKTLK